MDIVLFSKFMTFSMIEVMAAIAITLSLFRFKLTDYIWPALLASGIMNTLSFILRDEAGLASLSPVVNLLLLAIFVTIFVRVPLVWSFIMSIIGYAFSVLLQALIIVLSLGALSIAATDESLDKGYLLQTITGAILFVLSYLSYKFGLGFAFNFERLRFKSERLLILTLIVAMGISVGFLFYYKIIYIIILTLLFMLLFFVYYAAQKEVESIDSKLRTKGGPKN
ncbi:hypothetical protein J4772_11615 [Cohnella sp. LGH]|uniref:hypothetical protein n=1 Tax=Cohnella sp. LGH TaxID=1619153 RepID=UPI001ADC56BC|nr:hypothetical protein [Cohnella sp. LGH]QTH44986.1 hypothetical protein J4772_11615 [Cohnella sp. LGH]